MPINYHPAVCEDSGMAFLYTSVFLPCGERGTVFAGTKVSVAQYHCRRIQQPQFSEQRQQGTALCLRTSVGRTVAGIQSALITYAYRVCVVFLAMGAHCPQRSPPVDHTISGDVEVVADVCESTVAYVISATSLETQFLAFGRCGTVDYYQRYLSHKSLHYYAMQLCNPNAVAMAVSIPTAACIISRMASFFELFMSVLFFDFY